MANLNAIESLQNYFLIAMPSLNDTYFSRSVTFVVEHNAEGAMGIVINQPSSMKFKELVEMADEKVLVDDEQNKKIVVCGGPIHQDRGFVLHSSQAGFSSSISVTPDIMITTSKDILPLLGKSTGPKKSVVALGYAGWDAGQLEQEIQQNTWLTVEADENILFEVPIHQKWQVAVNKLGVDVWQLSQQSGQA